MTHMAEFDGISEFVKSGRRRLKDAEELLEQPSLDPNEAGAGTRHLRGAIYLAGYGVECMLKAYIISSQDGCKRLSQARDALVRTRGPVRDICGSSGHDLQYLLGLSGLEARMSAENLRQMEHCVKWRSSWRYDPRPVHRADAETRVRAARVMVDWLSSQI